MRKPKNFKEAAQASLDKRWLPASKAKTIAGIEAAIAKANCALCELQIGIAGCGECPLDDNLDGRICCKEWGIVSDATKERDFKKAHSATLSLCTRLQEIAKTGRLKK